MFPPVNLLDACQAQREVHICAGTMVEVRCQPTKLSPLLLILDVVYQLLSSRLASGFSESIRLAATRALRISMGAQSCLTGVSEQPCWHLARALVFEC